MCRDLLPSFVLLGMLFFPIIGYLYFQQVLSLNFHTAYKIASHHFSTYEKSAQNYKMGRETFFYNSKTEVLENVTMKNQR